jgi:chromosome segregation ATPase
MIFGFWRKKKKEQKKPADPLAAFDQLIEDLERQASEVRKSAATLLALKGELTRSAERYTRKLADMAERYKTAEASADIKAMQVFHRDQQQTEALLKSTREALERAEQDSKLLLEAANEVGERVTELRTERQSASARLMAGNLVTGAMIEKVERVDKVLAVHAARDEIERAHQLAEIYREERGAGEKAK